VKDAGLIALDEACAMVPVEPLISWQGDHKMVLAGGDSKQLPPAVLSYEEKFYLMELLVNRIGDLQRREVMKRLLLDEQFRMTTEYWRV
jgi:superfamily I DNA and/or RNA helicase